MPDNSPTSTTTSDQQKIQPSSSSNNVEETTTSNYGLFKEGNLFKTAVFFLPILITILVTKVKSC